MRQYRQLVSALMLEAAECTLSAQSCTDLATLERSAQANNDSTQRHVMGSVYQDGPHRRERYLLLAASLYETPGAIRRYHEW